MEPAIRTLEGDRLRATVSDFGAELQTLQTIDGKDLLWNGAAEFWSGRAPILFPIVGRAPGDRIAVDGREAEMAQHGFARRSPFSLEASGVGWTRHVLRESAATLAAYPFAFRLAVTHAIDGAALAVTAEVRNESEATMPFGLGFHPAFRWPLPGAEGLPHAITLANGAEPALARLEGGLLSRERLPSPFRAGRLDLHPDLFAEDALIFLEGAGDALRYGAADAAAPALSFRFENTPNLGIWSKPGAPFVCIEPWRGAAAEVGGGREIEDRPYAMRLPPGESARFGYAVAVHA